MTFQTTRPAAPVVVCVIVVCPVSSNLSFHLADEISLPHDAIPLLHSADEVTVVQKAMEHLQLDEAALSDPSADTRRKVRGLANRLKSWNRLDSLRHLRSLVPSGTTG